jgi:hypothetical protein
MYSLQYMSMNDLVQRILLGQLDIADSFKHILVRSRDWDLLGSTYYNTETHQKQYYVHLELPFGLRSSPKFFNEYADALQLIMLRNDVSEYMPYMDDYVTLGPKNSPNSVIKLIGFIVDTNHMELGLS